MRRQVKILFRDDALPGAAQALLAAAGCGSDVAIVEKLPGPPEKPKPTKEEVDMLYELVLSLRAVGAKVEVGGGKQEEAPPPRRKEEVTVVLDADDERLPLLLDLLRQHTTKWLEIRQDFYTDEEINSARLLVLVPLRTHTIAGGPRLGTLYEMKDACPVCGALARQTSALMITSDDASKLEGLRAASTYYRGILVDERLAEELSRVNATGLSFRGVYAVTKGGRQTKLRWRQMGAARTLPRFSPQSRGVESRRPCPSCGRSGFVMRINDPPRLAYRAEDVADIDDVMTTWEWFGDVDYKGDVSKAILPYPWVLVTPKVMRVLRAAVPPAFDFLPIRVVDEQ